MPKTVRQKALDRISTMNFSHEEMDFILQDRWNFYEQWQWMTQEGTTREIISRWIKEAKMWTAGKSVSWKLVKRIRDLGFDRDQEDFIFSDWPNWNEHIAWLETATRDEIIAWGEASEWGERTDADYRE